MSFSNRCGSKSQRVVAEGRGTFFGGPIKMFVCDILQDSL
jgi:hypothetical protein